MLLNWFFWSTIYESNYLNQFSHSRCQGKCCYKPITFYMQCQEMSEIVTFIIGRKFLKVFLNYCIFLVNNSR